MAEQRLTDDDGDIRFDDIDELKAHRNVRGRASGNITKGRYEDRQTIYAESKAEQIDTIILPDNSKSILSRSDSPDLGQMVSLNPYRGCEHGCIYCYARPGHEYFGLSAGLDFETKLFAKHDAPKLLREELAKKNYEPHTIMMSGVTDCYQPIERELEITRGCLEVLAEARNPVVIITKNHLVTRDLDILMELNRYNCAHVVLSITTLDGELARKMEPRASQPAMRLRAVKQLADAGIPVSVNMAPILPALTDHEIPTLLKAAADAGAYNANYVMLRLPYGVKDLFAEWLEQHFPDRKKKVLNRLREIRGGKLYNAEFGTRMSGEGLYAEQIAELFRKSRTRFGLGKKSSRLTTEHFRAPDGDQLSLF